MKARFAVYSRQATHHQKRGVNREPNTAPTESPDQGRLKRRVTMRKFLFSSIFGVLLVCGTVTAHAQSCYPAPDGLIGWWPGDGSPADMQGGHDGTPINGVWYAPGKVDEAFSFDGFDDYIDLGTPFNFGDTEFTVAAWILSEDGSNEPIVAQWHQWDGSWDFRVGWSEGVSDKLYFFATETGNNNNQIVHEGDLVTLGQWHHVAVVRSNNGLFTYVDGAEMAFGPFERTLHASTTINALIGKFSGWDIYYRGLIDEVTIFDQALSAGEIQAIFDADSAGMCKDADGDGYRPPEDCDESDPGINPDALELPWNFVDENCDGNLGDCDPCFDWRNHGEYVRCIAHAVNDLTEQGHLTEEEGDEIVSSAARSDIGKKGHTPPECQD